MGFILHLFVLVVGFLSSTAAVLGSLIPFGISFLAAAPKKYLPSAIFGVSAGYLLFITKGGFVYISAVFAIAFIKYILWNTAKITKTPLFSAALSFIILTVSAIVLSVSYEEDLLLLFGQALLSSAAAYFMWIAFRLDLTISVGLDIRESVSVLLFIGVILLSLYRFNILGLNLGRILASVFILATARFGQASYGAVSGAVIGFTLALYDGNLYFIAAAYAFGGLMAGLFSRLGSVGMVGAYLTTNIVSSLMTGDTENLAIMFFEALIGSGLFLMLPQKFNRIISGMLSPRPEITNPDTIKGALIMRLEFAGGALKDIFKTVEDVATSLKKINAPDFEKTLNEVENEVCIGCSLRKHCWETAKEITAEDTLRLWGEIKSGIRKDAEPLKINCIRPKNFENSVKLHCSNFDSQKSADRRVSEIRGVISDQFSAISNMLFDLCDEFKFEVHHDVKAAENIIMTMKNLGYHTASCVASVDKLGHLSADIHIKGIADKELNKMELLKSLSLACNKDFDVPVVSSSNDEAFISLTERPIYSVEVGVAQLSEERGKLCGDSYKYFCDGKGKFILLLSDGMGTGGRAAVDSAMVSGLMSRMISSGFGYDCSLKIINSSMLFKSTDESLATVDIASIDLFSGECELRKAGAAPTLIRKSGRVGNAASTSLPPGILRNVSFDYAKVNLKKDDIVVMLSDGATTEGTKWISEIIANWDICSAQKLADDIALAARRRRSDGHSDDITVLTAIIKEK
jgi:stage II sporulation protein E